eukprot:CAMPEP_0194029006 /NCGR_PEP_ID=MMETSP0009_2-20130614/2861_1 /TAXON_ID=210454 /ORGANISM="Grammatophora oceanica, Strain CCMP 410" /LENGTH=447 /DNA_ID=CAMNT_0038668569 /DNA_START=45 /DNA_END=1388 /DNA_ORIENTATION=+
MHFFPTSVLWCLATALLVGVRGQQEPQNDFQLIQNVPQAVTSLVLPPDCGKSGQHVKAMFTIEVSEDENVWVSSSPANLVSAKSSSSGEGDDETLRLVWNNVAYDSVNINQPAGVRIAFPFAQLKAVDLSSDVVAQILDGFTQLTSLKVSSDAVVSAALHSLADDTGEERLDVSVSSDAVATVASKIPVSRLSASSDAKVALEAPFVEEVKASSDAQVSIKGSVDGDIKVNSDARVTVDGNLAGEGNCALSSDAILTVYGNVTTSGTVSLSSDAKLRIGGVMGDGVEIQATSDSRVHTPNGCDQVSTSSDAKCIVDDSISGQVSVDVTVQDLTLTGKDGCGSWGWSSANKSWWIIVAVLVPLAVVFYATRHGRSGCCCCNKTSQHHTVEGGMPVLQSKPVESEKEGEAQIAVAYVVQDELLQTKGGVGSTSIGKDAIAAPINDAGVV